MKKVYLSLFALIFAALGMQAQVVHDVEVNSNFFDPAILTVEVGDTVRWTNMGGTHNVNGTTATYPSNPESFGNDVGPAGWVYTFVFNTPGTYDYQCDPHVGFGMTGQVIVNAPSSLEETFFPESPVLSAGPNPTSGIFVLDLDPAKMQNFPSAEVILFDAQGQAIRQLSGMGSDKVILSLSDQAAGVYWYRIVAEGKALAAGKILKQ